MIDALLGGVFVVAAYTEEIAERVATWADESLIKRTIRARATSPERN